MNYLDIANNDYLFLFNDIRRTSNNNNNCAVIAQQICEKLLKSILVKVNADAVILRSHNLKRICDTIKDEIEIERESYLYLSTLSDFYFDARYPGDDFILVSDEDIEMSFKVTHELHSVVNSWHRNKNLSNTDLFENAIKKMSGE